MNLADYLREAGLTSSQFAEVVGVPPSTITRIVRGDRTPRIETAAKIALATNGAVTANDFLPVAGEQTSDERVVA